VRHPDQRPGALTIGRERACILFSGTFSPFGFISGASAILGVLDSSFLIIPLGNDLLLIALSARRHELVPYYAAMATAGSVTGCFIMDVISRRGGEKGLERTIYWPPPHRVRQDKSKQKRRLGSGRCVVDAAAASLHALCSRSCNVRARKLLAVVAASRFFRFASTACWPCGSGPGLCVGSGSPVSFTSCWLSS